MWRLRGAGSHGPPGGGVPLLHDLHRRVARDDELQGLVAVVGGRVDGAGRDVDEVAGADGERLLQPLAYEEAACALDHVDRRLAVDVVVRAGTLLGRYGRDGEVDAVSVGELLGDALQAAHGAGGDLHAALVGLDEADLLLGGHGTWSIAAARCGRQEAGVRFALGCCRTVWQLGDLCFSLFCAAWEGGRNGLDALS